MKRLGFLLLLALLPPGPASAGQTTFTYDGNGNLVQRNVNGVITDFLFDLRDQLVEVRQGESILVRYQYDAEGRMLLKIGQDGVRQYVYSGRRVVAEYDGDGGVVAHYTWDTSGQMIELSFRAGAGFVTYYPAYDGLGSIIALTDKDGVVVARYHYDAWGNFRDPGELTTTPNRFGFTGHLWQPEIGMYQARARFLDPSLGRFISADPFPPDLSRPALNRYLYALNAPARYTDPLGLWEWDATLGGSHPDADLQSTARSRNAPDDDRRKAKEALEGRRAFRAGREQAIRAKDALPPGADQTRAERALSAYGQEGDAPVEDVIRTPSGSVRFVRRTMVGREAPADPRTRGTTRGTMDEGSTWNEELQQQTLELRTRVMLSPEALGNGGPALGGTVAHEGSHAADHQRLHASIVVEKRDGTGGMQSAIGNPAVDLTQLDTERDAYRVSASIAEGEYRRGRQQTPGATAGGTTVYSTRQQPADHLTYQTGTREHGYTDHVIWDASWPETDSAADQDPTRLRQDRASRRDRAIDTFLAVGQPDGIYGFTAQNPGSRLSAVGR